MQSWQWLASFFGLQTHGQSPGHVFAFWRFDHTVTEDQSMRLVGSGFNSQRGETLKRLLFLHAWNIPVTILIDDGDTELSYAELPHPMVQP